MINEIDRMRIYSNKIEEMEKVIAAVKANPEANAGFDLVNAKRRLYYYKKRLAKLNGE